VKKIGIVLFLISLALAWMEVEIEGTGFWAKNLPTWRPFGYGEGVPTGYHFAMWSLMLLMFHFVFAFTGFWSWKQELRILMLVCLVAVFEDFLWQVINPGWNVSLFLKTHHSWYYGYPMGIILAGLLAWRARRGKEFAVVLNTMVILTLLTIMVSGFLWRQTKPERPRTGTSLEGTTIIEEGRSAPLFSILKKSITYSVFFIF
jgi:hypothetical protein